MHSGTFKHKVEQGGLLYSGHFWTGSFPPTELPRARLVSGDLSGFGSLHVGWGPGGKNGWVTERGRIGARKLEKLSEMDSITLAPDFLKILNNNKLVLTN